MNSIIHDVRQRKLALRKQIRSKLNNQKEDDRQQRSCHITEQLCALPVIQNARIIMSYVSLPTEVDTFSLLYRVLAMGKILAVPFMIEDEKRLVAAQITDIEHDLSCGPFGILQPEGPFVRPVKIHELSCVIVPGLAFTQAGKRLGRGGGYYDRFLAALPTATETIGLAFDFQVLADIPTTSFDQAVDRIVFA